MWSINMKGPVHSFRLQKIVLLAIFVLGTTGVQYSHGTTLRADYPRVQFSLDDTSSVEPYRKMIADLRALLTSHGEYRQGIPMLREPGLVPDSERYILLEISVSGRAVTFAIDVTNVYIIGYLIEGSSGDRTRYFFQEAPDRADELLFTDATATSSQRRSSNYNSLESRAHASRERINLGLHNLDYAIRTLQTGRPEDPRSIIIVLQMVAEAVRSYEIETHTLRDASASDPPSTRMLDLENNWEALSEQIQVSEVFAFRRPISIAGQVVDSVLSPLISTIFLMLFKCHQPPSAVALDHHGQVTLGISRHWVEDHPAATLMQLVTSSGLEDDEPTCDVSVDPRSRIKGRDGQCVDVKDFAYGDNNPVILFTCKSSDYRNQLWKFQRDGRIVSMEKCLAASGHTPGSTVIIHECETLLESQIQWSMNENGTLFNRHSRLVLAAHRGSSGQLELEDDASSSFQAWVATNTSLVDAYIRGEKNTCIYYDGEYGVYTKDCDKSSSRQQWRLYPDSTVRPIDWLDGCLELYSTSADVLGYYNYIQAGYCTDYSVHHRWIFTHKGTIMNLVSELVVDADEDYPGYLKAAPFQGGPNQIWTLEFI